MNPKILAIGLAMLSLSARAADLIPVEDFARPPKFTQISLSPDGEYIGYIREINGVPRFCCADVETMKMAALDLGGEGPWFFQTKGVHGYRWIGDKRIVVQSGIGWLAVDRDMKNARPLSGEVYRLKQKVDFVNFFPMRVMHSFNDDHDALVATYRYQGIEVDRLNTISGSVSTVAKNPGNVSSWLADNQGRVRLAMAREGDSVSILYRKDDDAEWSKVASFGVERHIHPVVFSDDNRYVYTAARSPSGSWSLYKCDPSKMEIQDAVWSGTSDVYGVLVEPRTKTLIGVLYTESCVRTAWLDAKYEKLQAAVDAALPDTVNAVRFIRKDGKKALVVAFSDRTPEVAYLVDIDKGELKKLGDSRPEVRPEEMSQMRSVKYKARDGLEIAGYLTIPKGLSPSSLPVVVMPHDAPMGGQDTWGYDPLVQMLASRGYAVFQMNYRGSGGYGQEFQEKGRHEAGGKIQDDIEDGVRWLISKKLADPKRVAIVGEGFGGYSAMLALARNPGLYCCGISIRGYFDLGELFKKADPVFGQASEMAKRHWTDLMGDLDKEGLKRFSPVHMADAIVEPTLLVYTGSKGLLRDSTQAVAMASALKKAGHKPELFAQPVDMESWAKGNAQIATYKAIEAFLAKHIGSAAVPVKN